MAESIVAWLQTMPADRMIIACAAVVVAAWLLSVVSLELRRR